ncbi:MAG: glycoside hydrolase family 9 protein, partial [Armatimonadota bacterium]|nr:glycoside hydrolase family 9 protein [Armatimonadota bacterium]
MSPFRPCLLIVVLLIPAVRFLRADTNRVWDEEGNPLALSAIGSHRLRILSPTILELTLVTTKAPGTRPDRWDFVDDNGSLRLPPSAAFRVVVNGAEAPVQAVGFKRRPLYAPLARRDLRIGSFLYLRLAQPIPDGASVQVTNPGSTLWQPEQPFAATAQASRFSPAIHVNQVGYATALPKKAIVGYYLGSLGELEIPQPRTFKLVEAHSGHEVYAGALTPREDRGFTYTVAPYQRVFEADFSRFQKAGEYRLLVPGLGASWPFFIADGAAAAFARTYALGLYHQRCGAANELPFTRFVHAPCHTAPAEIPTMEFKFVQKKLADMSSDFQRNPRHTAPQLKDVNSSLYPFVNAGKIDVSGGHHDAGDYSKYTINSAQFIHHLVFAIDAFPGVGDLDNLGLPESGDGVSDLIQIAKWEADFLAKMQDADGGFYFLVYPRDRAYESNVLPEHGDPQVVYPKNTTATAAAVAALAQTATSPRFKRAFPEAAAVYLAKARQGWEFLQRAIAKYGRDGAYQKITHYGDTFMHDDELAWAATEMFLATGDAAIQQNLIATFDPAHRDTRKWSWVRLFEGYGCAIRSYAFAAKTGRIDAGKLDETFLQKCTAEIRAAAEEQVTWAQGNAYGTSFPFESKRFRTSGWYFPVANAFDLVAAYQLDPKPEYLAAVISNLDFEAGANPNNVTFLTGLGWKRQHEIVHHYAMNDRRELPPSGIPLGSIQAGFPYLAPYGKELGLLTFPSDGDKDNAFAFYDRWGDTFNTSTEFVAVQQARGLATLAFLMAQTPLKDQAWRATPAQIIGVPARVKIGQSVTARVAGLDTSLVR